MFMMQPVIQARIVAALMLNWFKICKYILKLKHRADKDQ
jgi:hypothetical protein